MQRLGLVLVVAVLLACSASPASPPRPSAVATPSSAPTPSPSPMPQVACELPYLITKNFDPFRAVGFLKLPEGVFHPDPTAGSSLPPGGVQAIPTPGGGQPWWDAQARRWIPVHLSSVSPDGQSYAYMSADGLHRVLIATGSDALVYRRPKGVLGGQVLGYRADLYIVFPSAVKGGAGSVITNPPGQVGVWKVDIASGSASRIRSSDDVGSMVGDALWITPVSGHTLGDSLDRVDLASGQQTIWFTDPGRTIQFLGVDQVGLPIVWTFADGHLEIWRIAAPNQATNFHSIDYTGAAPIYGPEMQQGLLIADQHGVWFGASDGLYIYDGGGFRKIATTSGIPAGPCQ